MHKLMQLAYRTKPALRTESRCPGDELMEPSQGHGYCFTEWRTTHRARYTALD